VRATGRKRAWPWPRRTGLNHSPSFSARKLSRADPTLGWLNWAQSCETMDATKMAPPSDEFGPRPPGERGVEQCSSRQVLRRHGGSLHATQEPRLNPIRNADNMHFENVTTIILKYDIRIGVVGRRLPRGAVRPHSRKLHPVRRFGLRWIDRPPSVARQGNSTRLITAARDISSMPRGKTDGMT